MLRRFYKKRKEGMAASPQLVARMRRELKMLATDPPPGVAAWPEGDRLDHLRAQIQGPEDTPYVGGTFDLTLRLSARYPFDPPQVRFVTPVYHPNVDSGGRICLDTLKMPPKGSWVPSLNVLTLLSTIRVLLAEPNADDGLMPEITAQFKRDRGAFDDAARAWTQEHASSAARDGASAAPAAPSSSGGASASASAPASALAVAPAEGGGAAGGAASAVAGGDGRAAAAAVGTEAEAERDNESGSDESGSEESGSESSDFGGFGGNDDGGGGERAGKRQRTT